MHKSRTLVLVGAALGILSAFMPWASIGRLSVSGIDGSDGYIVIGVFAACLVLGLAGDKRAPISTVATIVVIVLAGLGGIAHGIWKISSLSDESVPFRVSAGAGLYLMVVAGVVAIIGTVLKGSVAPSARPPA